MFVWWPVNENNAPNSGEILQREVDLNLLVISRMAGARNEQHSVQTISAVNMEEGDEKRKNSPADLDCKSSIKFIEIYLTEQWIP